MLPNKRASSAAANNPIRIIFVICNHGRSAAKRAMSSPSRSAARITAPSIAPATSGLGGRRSASTPSTSPVSSGDKPDSMIHKTVTSRVWRRSRRLDQLFRPLTVWGNRGPIRLHKAERTTVERREQHGRAPQCRKRRPALSRKRWQRFCRPYHRRPSGTWPLRGKRFQAWLRQQYAARGRPYPVLAIAGEQGSAKTVLSKLLRAVIDPSVAPVRTLPRDERELFIAASNGHILAFDNLSGLPLWLSDTLCRLTSGGAFSTRRLFTDQDEILFAAARPVILSGIEDTGRSRALVPRTLSPLGTVILGLSHASWVPDARCQVTPPRRRCTIVVRVGDSLGRAYGGVCVH
jgi:hypothetical protein